LDGAGKDPEAAKAYQSATRIKRDETPAWQGLIRLYEKQGSIELDQYHEAALHLAQIYQKA
jgi:superkiller protein 3